MTLTSRTVLITGAKRIGADVGLALARRGADVAVSYQRSQVEADALAAAVRAEGRRALVVQADVTQLASCLALVEAVDRTFGRLDVLINMASVYHPVRFDDFDEAEWRRQLGADLDGSFFCARAAVPLMRKHGGGRIINFSDWLPTSGRPRYPGYLGYYVAKAGVKALTEALALELAPDGILVNAVAPGPMLAPPGTPDVELEAVRKATPLGRWGGPEPIVQAVLAFIESDFLTGETIRVDGGRHLA